METRIFATDYQSYNEGRQFTYGKWVDLSDFSDAEEVLDHIKENCIPPEIKDDFELMITDFEGFPRFLYSEAMSGTEIENILSYIKEDFENYDDNDWLNLHNEYYSENNADNEIFEFDEEFFNTFFADKPMEAARAASFGQINWGDQYIKFNGYANLESFDSVESHIDKDELIKFKLGL